MEASRVYFVGLKTAGSAAYKAFPKWLKVLTWNAELVTIDIPRDGTCEAYVRFMSCLREDSRCVGAQVTSHKLRLYKCLATELDSIEHDADSLGEIGAIAASGGTLIGFSPDMLALREELPRIFSDPNWRHGSREVIILGAGGAGRAIALASAHCAIGGISRITMTERIDTVKRDAASRLKVLLDGRGLPRLVVRDASENDEIIEESGPGSLIVNATGLGKDLPGSPISEQVNFPRQSIIWDLNYRGELRFLQKARFQRIEQQLTVLDGWNYFLRNWYACLTRLGRVPPSEDQFVDFSKAADCFHSLAEWFYFTSIWRKRWRPPNLAITRTGMRPSYLRRSEVGELSM